ncbi:hypothetical protein TTHERM_00378950 (macronuclear) [Tetrahymena thermophila SB210]|uniref:Vacuolar protein 8 n=1 Tax=Tetrahymena thermophila (strain SB210) TaxID=312017 RepID=Q23FC2_TETTS|nr:hypothetical protein TTHERM_00378950 [Tetrahymena thermophila SB210]EAR95231.2 hypothetical protein TTHERM_00378950 [Tetrahymena thermophila SB210]|eukprot:XP_001015476.2 hypothetical protein TTHERM_00378950 [Tetrahymena thermophila SB210]
MFKDQNDIFIEIKKRPAEKTLSFSELAQLREVPYKYFKSEPIFLQLLNQYCRDSKFQIRVCERSFILTTIVPLMQKDNPLEVIQGASECLALLSQNSETHEKILKSGALKTIAMLIKDNLHHKITKNCIQIFSNLCRDVNNFYEFLSHQLQRILVCQYLDQVDFETQKYILQILISLCTEHPDNLYSEDMKIILKKQKYCAPLARAIVSPNQEVSLHSITLFKIFIENDSNIKKLQKFDLAPRILQAYRLFRSQPNNQQIIRAILEFMEQMLQHPEYYKILQEEIYIQIVKEAQFIDNFEIQYRSLSCLTKLSEGIDTQTKLIDLGVLNSMCDILRQNKEIKLRRQALKFISNLSFNPFCIQLLVYQEIIDLIIIQINSTDRDSRIKSVITISNLSVAPNFHKKLQNINIKSLIHIFEQSDTSIEVMRAAANTLANISLDHAYQVHFLRDPEKSILLNLIKTQEDIQLLKSIIIIFSNVVSNQTLSIISEELLDIFIKLYLNNRIYYENDIRGYISKVISKFCISPECRKTIISKKVMKRIIDDIYSSRNETKKQLLISLMTMIYCSKDMHTEFFESNGIDCLLSFLNRQDSFQIYLAFKCFTLLSRWEKNIDIITTDDICSRISKNSLIRERRILKEGLRFFINIMIYKRQEKEIVNRLCWLINEGLRNKDDPECLKLSLFALMIVSEQMKYHRKLITHTTLLQNLSIQTQEDLNQFTDFFSKIMMNLSLNPDCHEVLLEKKFIQLTKEICLNLKEKDEFMMMNNYSYLLTFACQMLKIDNIAFHLKELFKQGIVQILYTILQQSYEFMFHEIIEAFNIILAESESYPDSLFETIQKLADDTYMIQDNDTVYMRIYILMSLSKKPQSRDYFKSSNVVKLIKKFLMNYKDWSLNIVPNCCTLLANISKQPELLKQILDENLINLIFKIWSEKQIISFTDLVRLLAQITSLPLFNSSTLDEQIYPFVFNFLYQQISEKKPNNSLVNASLLCVLNMTKSDFGLAKAVSQSKTIQLVKTIIQRSEQDIQLLQRKSFYNQLMICVLMASNLLIDSEFAQKNKQDILDILNCMHNNVTCTKFMNLQINTGFLKILHNLVIQNYALKNEPAVRKSIELAYQLFNEISDIQCQTFILNIMNHLLQDKSFFESFKENQILMTKISDQFLTTLITPQNQDTKFRFSLYTFLTNVSYYENSIEFFESFLNLEEFVQKFKTLFQDSNKAEQEALLCFLANLCNIKEVQNLLLKHNKVMQLIKEILIEHRFDSLTWTSIRLLGNISANPDYHFFIAQEDILKCLYNVFIYQKTSLHMKEKIQGLLANVTFTKKVHEIMIKNDCMKIFELILNKEDQLQDTQQNHMIISMIQLGLNHKNFHMLENDINLVNSLSMVNECEKPLQVRLLQIATFYILDNSQDTTQNRESKLMNKLDISREIMSYIKMNLETRSAYFIRHLGRILSELTSWEHFSQIQLDYTKLTVQIINIIIFFDNIDQKLSYFQVFKKMTSSEYYFNNTSNLSEQLTKLLKFNQIIISKLESAQPKTIQEQNRIKGEQFIVLFLQLLSNCSLFGAQNQEVAQFLISQQIDEFITLSLRLGKIKSYNILAQVICTLSNFYQNEQILKSCYSYANLFSQLQIKYKKYIQFNKEFEYYLAGLISVVLKIKKYKFTDVVQKSSANFDENVTNEQIEDGDKNKDTQKVFVQQIQNLLRIQQGNMNLNGSNLNKSVSIMSNESDIKNAPLDNDENKFIFSFFIMILKKGAERTRNDILSELRQKGESQTLQCIANVCSLQENHKLILSTKIPEYLFNYLSNEKSITFPFYSYALAGFLHIARGKEIYSRIKSEDIFIWFKMVVQQYDRSYVEKSLIAVINMIEYAKFEDYQIYVEDIIEFVTLKIISVCQVNDPLLDRALILIQKIIKIKTLKYKISKSEVLFQELFKFLLEQKLSDENNFEGYFKIWEVLQNFFDSRECLSQILKYGLVKIIKMQLNYYQDYDLFYEEVKQQKKNEKKNQNSFNFIIERIKLLGLILDCVNSIFQKDQPQYNQNQMKFKLVYSKEKNVSESNDRIVNIHFYSIYEVLKKIEPQLKDEKISKFILIISHLLLNMSKVLIRVNEGSCLPIVKFIMEMMKSFELNDSTFRLMDKLTIRQCIFQTLNILLEKYEPEMQPHLEEILNLMINNMGNEYKVIEDQKSLDLNLVASRYRQVYVNFLNIITKVDFKQIKEQAVIRLAKKIFQIIQQNQDHFQHDSMIRFFFLVFIKKFLLSIDIRNQKELIDSYNEMIEYLNSYIEFFNIYLKRLIDSIDRNLFTQNSDYSSLHNQYNEEQDRESQLTTQLFMQELDMNNLILVFETLILLVYFTEFPSMLSSEQNIKPSDIIQTSFICCIRILEFEEKLNSFTDSEQKEKFLEERRIKQNELNSILKVNVIFINQLSYFQKLQNSLLDQQNIKILINGLIKKKKTIQMFCYNTLTNFAEINGLIYLKNLMLELDVLIKETNQQMIKQEIKIDIEPLIALLEHVFQVLLDVENNQMLSSLKFMKEQPQIDTQNAKNVIIEFITDLVLEKGGIVISQNLYNILFQICEQDLHLQSRVLYIILKNHIQEENKMEVKDFIMKKLRVLMIEHVRMFKEIQDKEQELKILLEEYQDILKDEEIEGLEKEFKYHDEEEEVQSISQTDENIGEDQQQQVQNNFKEFIDKQSKQGDESPFSSTNKKIPVNQSLRDLRKSDSKHYPNHKLSQQKSIDVNSPLLRQNSQISLQNHRQQSQENNSQKTYSARHIAGFSQENQEKGAQTTSASQIQQPNQNSSQFSQQSQYLKQNNYTHESVNSQKQNNRRKSSQSNLSKMLANRTLRKQKIKSRVTQLQLELEKIAPIPLNAVMIWKFLERPVRNYEGIKSISNSFFWEYFKEPLTEYQHIVLNFMFCLIIIQNKSKNDSSWRSLLLQNHDIFLKVLDLEYINVYKQPGFLFCKYIGETLINIFSNKGKKTEVIKSDKFAYLRKVLLNSKIRELVDISKSLEVCIKNK